MTGNHFGRTSKLVLSARNKNGVTVLSDEYFTAPFKIMKPFPQENGGISVMLLTASAGLMQGDRQEISLSVGEGAHLTLTSQAYEKIHKMTGGYAERRTEITMEEDSFLNYAPLPVIPFAESDFRAATNIRLAERSKLILSEILSCGRYCRDERFRYKNYSSLTLAMRGERLIYRDNAVYRPEQIHLEGTGFYEGHTYLLSMTAFGFSHPLEIKHRLDSFIADAALDGGASLMCDGDLVFRVLGGSGDKLTEISEKASEILKRFI